MNRPYQYTYGCKVGYITHDAKYVEYRHGVAGMISCGEKGVRISIQENKLEYKFVKTRVSQDCRGSGLISQSCWSQSSYITTVDGEEAWKLRTITRASGYRWGSSGEWKSTSVAPGRWVKLMWNYKYSGENRSPQLTVRYDDNTTSSTNIVRTDLKAYAASDSNCENQGKTYNFYERGSELYIKEED